MLKKTKINTIKSIEENILICNVRKEKEMSHFLLGVVAKSETSAELEMEKFSSYLKVKPYILYTHEKAIQKGKESMTLLNLNPDIKKQVLSKKEEEMNDEDFFKLFLKLKEILYGEKVKLDENKNVLSTSNPYGYIGSYIDSFDWNNDYNGNVSVNRFLKDYYKGVKGDFYEDRIFLTNQYLFVDKEKISWNEKERKWQSDPSATLKEEWVSKDEILIDDFDEQQEEYEQKVISRLEQLKDQGYYIFFYECT